MSDLSKQDKEIISLYALVTVGSILMVIPYSILPFAGLACAFVGFAAAYFYKWFKRGGDAMQFHARYIIKTGWWSTLILFIGILIFGSIIYFNGDLSSIFALVDGAGRGVVPNENEIRLMQLQFIRDNLSLIGLGAIVLIPYPAFLIYRMIRGVRKLIKTT
jgi:uncharacterized membrane protein